MDISVNFDKRQMASLERELRDLGSGAVPRVLNSGINRTLPTARARATRRIRAATMLKAKDIRASIGIIRSTVETLAGHVVVKPRKFPLSMFGAKQTATGVTYRLGTGQTGTILGAFIATMRSGHTGVYTRVGKARLPIVERRGPALTDIYGAPGVLDEEMSQIGDVLEKNVASQVDRLLARRAS